MTELLAAVAAFLLAALTGGRLAGWLQKKGMGRSLMVKKGESVTPGQEVGCVRYFAGDRELCCLPITAAASVGERTVAGYWERLWDYWRELLLGFLRL